MRLIHPHYIRQIFISKESSQIFFLIIYELKQPRLFIFEITSLNQI